MADIPKSLADIEYDESSRIVDESAVPIGGTQIHNLYAVQNLENRIPILKTVVIRTATLDEIIDALLDSDEFHEFFENYLISGGWLRYSTEPPYTFSEYKPNTLYFNTSDIYYGNGGLPPGVDIGDPNVNPPKYENITLTLISENGTSYYPILLGSTYEQVKDKLPVPTKEDCVFVGWSLQENGEVLSDLYMFRGSTALYAIFKSDTVLVRVNGSPYPVAVHGGMTLGEVSKRLAPPKRPGKKFAGYALKPNGAILNDFYNVKTDILLYPVYL